MDDSDCNLKQHGSMVDYFAATKEQMDEQDMPEGGREAHLSENQTRDLLAEVYGHCGVDMDKHLEGLMFMLDRGEYAAFNQVGLKFLGITVVLIVPGDEPMIQHRRLH